MKKNRKVKLTKKKLIMSLCLAVMVVFVMEFLCFLIYHFLLPEPFVKEGDNYILNQKYSIPGFPFESDKESMGIKKNLGTLRIFNFGASTTAGWPYGIEFSYNEYLKKYLKDAFPDREIEVVNLALPGIDSLEIRYAIEKSIKYQPDIIIVYTSHNNIEEYTLKKLKIGAFSRCFAFFKNTNLFKVLNHSANLFVNGFLQNWFVRPGNTSGLIFDKSILSEGDKIKLTKNYSENLNAIADLCNDNGIQLIIIKPIFNMTGYGPVYSNYSRNLTEDTKNQFNNKLQTGIFLLKSGRIDSALEKFQQCETIDSDVAILDYYLSICYYKKKNLKKALFHRRKSTNLDGLWAVCPDMYQKALDEITNSGDIITLPLLKRIGEKTGTHFLDEAWFSDDIHPTPYAHEVMACILFESMIEKKWFIPLEFKPSISTPPISYRQKIRDEAYFEFCKDMGIYKYHLSYWAYDPLPILKESRDFLNKYFNSAKKNAPSMDSEVYFYGS